MDITNKNTPQVQCQVPSPTAENPQNEKLRTVCLDGEHTCCLRALAASQPDFKSQKSRLEELIHSRGHLCIFSPKFHPELSHIEYRWGALKRYCRANCGYSIRALRKTIPRGLDSISNKFTWETWARTERAAQAYREKKQFGTKEYIKKVYRSHRRVLEGETKLYEW